MVLLARAAPCPLNDVFLAEVAGMQGARGLEEGGQFAPVLASSVLVVVAPKELVEQFRPEGLCPTDGDDRCKVGR
jgi:hypothetical protein